MGEHGWLSSRRVRLKMEKRKSLTGKGTTGDLLQLYLNFLFGRPSQTKQKRVRSQLVSGAPGFFGVV